MDNSGPNVSARSDGESVGFQCDLEAGVFLFVLGRSRGHSIGVGLVSYEATALSQTEMAAQREKLARVERLVGN